MHTRERLSTCGTESHPKKTTKEPKIAIFLVLGDHLESEVPWFGHYSQGTRLVCHNMCCE